MVLPSAPRLIMLGMRCISTRTALDALVRAGLAPGELVLPATATARRWPFLPGRLLPLAGGGVDAIAAAAGVRIREVPTLRGEPGAALVASGPRPDLGVVVCSPFRIPRGVLEWPRLGWINLHPSLLPRHRGPEPIFWTLHAGDATTGVTVHRVVAAMDAGPVFAQESLRLEAGLRYREIEERCARLGGPVLVEVVAGLLAGRRDAWPQDESRASYEPLPGVAELRLPPGWGAERAYRFVRGVAHWQPPPWIDWNGQRVVIEDATTWSGAGAPSPLDTHDTVRWECPDGWVQLRVRGAP